MRLIVRKPVPSDLPLLEPVLVNRVHERTRWLPKQIIHDRFDRLFAEFSVEVLCDEEDTDQIYAFVARSERCRMIEKYAKEIYKEHEEIRRWFDSI